MSDEISIGLSEEDKQKHLLQYLLGCRGVCHENMLLKVLILIEYEQGGVDESFTVFDWQRKLQEHISQLNYRLQPLKYQIKKSVYGFGKDIVSQQMLGRLHVTGSTRNENWAAVLDQMVFPNSSQYYIYIDTSPYGELKPATRFSDKEIDYIKGFLAVFSRAGSVRTPIDEDYVENNAIVQEVNRIRQKVYSKKRSSRNNEDEDDDSDHRAVPSWDDYISYTSDIAALTDSTDMQPLEVQDLLTRLCEYRWFYKTEKARYGMDLRLLVEMNDYLTDVCDFSPCMVCKDVVVTLGVRCSSLNCPSMWHVDCYEHDILHENKKCNKCEESILDKGIYIT